MNEHKKTGLIVTTDGRSSDVTYFEFYPGANVRLINAAKRFAIFIGVAIAAIFVPILHFVLVPAALIVGVVMAYFALNEKHVYSGIEGACPACGTKVYIEKMNAASNLKDLCGQCRFSLKFSPTKT